MTTIVYRKVPAGILRIELRRSVCNTPFTRETLLRAGTAAHAKASKLVAA